MGMTQDENLTLPTGNKETNSDVKEAFDNKPPVTMRAKFRVSNVNSYEISEQLKFNAVCGNAPFGPDGESEDNTFARYTPCAELVMTVSNPVLRGKFKEGDTFYVDFTPTK